MKKRLGWISLAAMMTLLGGCATTSQLNEEAQGESSKQVETQENATTVMSVNHQTLAQSLDAYLKERAFNGVALVASEDEIILLQPYGMANVENQEAMSVDHQFHIASVSKSFVAVSILQLVEEGKLSLDQTIESYFPDMPHADQITIHQLLTHTSGLYSGDDLTDYSREVSVMDVIAPAFKASNLYYEEPGTQSIYSNLGYDVLGAIIEQVSGQTYSDYLEEHIFQPAGMTDSGLNVSGEKIEHLATAYNGNIANGDEAKVLHPSFGYSSGGLHSTATDLYKYDRALRENVLISGESYRLMTQAYSTIGTSAYGYGWFVNAGVENTVSHTGNLIGWHSMFLRHQEDKVTVILLTNHDESDMYMAYNLARLVLAEKETS